MACQRTTNAVAYIYFNEHCYLCINYTDDFGGAASPEEAEDTFQKLKILLFELGLEVSPDKEFPPSSMIFLGILYDTAAMTISIPADKLKEIKSLIRTWLSKPDATVLELQSLMGKLSYVCSCICPGRLFMQRLLNVLCSHYSTLGSFQILAELFDDLKWWSAFLNVYNGVSLIPEPVWVSDPSDFSVDACDSGCGGFYYGFYFHLKLIDDLLDLHIITKELLSILIACDLWKDKLPCKRLIIRSDNTTVVSEVNTSCSVSPYRQKLLREIWYLSSLHHFELSVIHVPGIEIEISDCLSRWHLAPFTESSFLNLFLIVFILCLNVFTIYLVLSFHCHFILFQLLQCPQETSIHSFNKCSSLVMPQEHGKTFVLFCRNTTRSAANMASLLCLHQRILSTDLPSS